MKSPAQFPGILTDEIITHGAPTKLISDSARVKSSKEVHGILRTYGISSWQSEPHQQHQNPAERRYQTVKRLCNTILDQTGAPAYCWLLCFMYVCFVLNNAFSEVIQPVYPSSPGLRHRQRHQPYVILLVLQTGVLLG
jgi:transposase InsO family protein